VHVLNNYATCFEKEGNHDRAIALFREMEKISPLFSDGIINLSGAYFNAGRFEEAYVTMNRFKWDEQHPRSHEFMVAIFGKKLELLMQEKRYTEKQKQRMAACNADDACILRSIKESQQQKVPFDVYVMGPGE
jgi:hypothetical protein